MHHIEILYCFKFDADNHKQYKLQMNESTYELQIEHDDCAPTWTDLEFNQCQHCPLFSDEVEKCPVAVNLIPFIDLCGNLSSYDTLDVEIQTSQRSYFVKETTTQRAFSSLLGLIIATSNCPHTSFFRSMARFHLPLANEHETLFRAASSYLLMQYFKKQSGKETDFNLQGLEEIYKNIQIVNKSMAMRLRAACQNDAAVNSIILLDMLAKGVPYSIEEALSELRYLYKDVQI